MWVPKSSPPQPAKYPVFPKARRAVKSQGYCLKANVQSASVLPFDTETDCSKVPIALSGALVVRCAP